MFIKEVTTKNFGVLADGMYSFVDGMNIIRGANEKGKSTLTEAILYGLFGSGALRGTIDDTVREGQPPSDLRVIVKYGDYTAKRGKSSASVVGLDTKINGQAKVSEFFYDLLGVRKGSENSVLISEQGETAGILKGKPGEVSALIEGLAGFDEIDNVVEAVKEKYPSGNVKIFKELLVEVGEKIEEKEAIELINPNVYLDKVRQGEAGLKVAEGEIGKLQSSITSKQSEVIEIEAGVKLKEKLSGDIARATSDIVNIDRELETTHKAAVEELHDVSKEKELVNNWPEAVAKWNLYKETMSFGIWEADEWDGDVDSLNAELLNQNKEANELTSILSDAKAEIRNLNKQMNDEDICPTCGQDTKHLHKEINERLRNGITLQESTVSITSDKLKEMEQDITTLRLIQAEQNKRQVYEEYVRDTGVLPWHLEWRGRAPTEPSREKFHIAGDLISIAEDLERKVTKAKTNIPKLDIKLDEKQEELIKLQEEFNSTFTEDPTDLKEIITALKKAHGEELEAYLADEKEVKANQKEADRLTLEAEFLEKEIDNLNKEHTELNDKLKKDKHNREILKQVRKARPLVLNRVWSNVLNMVSSTFSDLRGVESKVEKSDKGFLVNGLPVHRLSGSGKSILGISLRVALREIFAPAAGFLFFDEPAADCDSDRTAAVMAAISSIRGQIIMITHEELSDSSADNVIELI